MRNSRNIAVCLVILSIIIAGHAVSSAQSVDCSLRLLHTFSSFDLLTASGGTSKGRVTLGHGIAAIVGVELSKHFGMQGEIIYSSSSHLFKEEDAERRIDVKYIHIPILFVFNTGTSEPVNIRLEAGPQYGLNVGSTMTATGGNGTMPTAVLSIRSTDIGFAYGVGAGMGIDRMNLLRLTIGFRGVAGLTTMSDTSGTLPPNLYYVLGASRRDTYSGYIGLSFAF